MSWAAWFVGWLWFAPSPPVCVVHVEGMPISLLRHHSILVGAERREAARSVEIPRLDVEALLVGPRYTGASKLPDRCDAPVVLKAKPKPARVKLTEAPPNTVVSCVDCPGIDPHANFLVSNLPPMVMKGWAMEVTFWVRASGYESRREVAVLHPGQNDVRVPLNPRR